MSLQTNYEDFLTFYVKKYIFLLQDLNITIQGKIPDRSLLLLLLLCLVLSRRLCPMWQLPNFVISLAHTSQVCPSRSALPLAHPSRSSQPQLQPVAPKMA